MERVKENGNVELLIIGMYFISILTFKDSVISILANIIIAIVLAKYFFRQDFYKVAPVFIFFYSQLVLPGGIVLFRIFTYIYIGKKLLYEKIKIIPILLIPTSIIFSCYLFVVSNLDQRIALSLIIDLIFLVLYTSEILYDKEKFNQFLKFYVLAAICSNIYGFLRVGLNMSTYIYSEGKYIQITRFLATFVDPNYAGIFFNIAIIIVLLSNIFKAKTIKLVFMIILYIGLFSTISITAIICNIIIIGLYFIYKMNIKKAILMFLLPVCIFNVYNLSLNKEIAVVSTLSKRVETKLQELSDNKVDSLTSDRTELWKKNLEFFKNQSPIKILIGGNFISDYGTDPNFIEVSHEVYIDMLLNFGIIGTTILVLYVLYKLINNLMLYIKLKEREYLVLVFIKIIWIFYGFGLSMFPNWSFLLLLFI